MMATIVKPPSKHQIELMNKIWNELERIFGEKARTAGFVRPYFEYPDGRVKMASDLAVKLQELKEIECLLPGEQGK